MNVYFRACVNEYFTILYTIIYLFIILIYFVTHSFYVLFSNKCIVRIVGAKTL